MEIEGLRENHLTISLAITCLTLMVIVQAMGITMEISMGRHRQKCTMVKTSGSTRPIVIILTSKIITTHIRTQPENIITVATNTLAPEVLSTLNMEIRVLEELSGVGGEETGIISQETEGETSPITEVFQMMLMRTYLENRMARFKEWRVRVLEDLSEEGVEEVGKTSLGTEIMSQSKEVKKIVLMSFNKEDSPVRLKTMFSTLGKSIQNLPKTLARDQDRAALVTRIRI